MKILAVEETTGAIQSWNPSVNSVLGDFSVASSTSSLTIGGDFTKVSRRGTLSSTADRDG